MKTILYGLPQTGKSTLFRLLTGFETSDIRYDSSGSPMPQVGTVSVPDERVDFLHSIYPESKPVYAQIEYTDLVGLKFGDVKESRLLAYLRQGDVMVHVVRAFNNDAVFHEAGDVDPTRDIKMMEDEMVLSDLMVLENRYEKLQKLVMKAKNPADALQLSALDKIKPLLEDGKSLRGVKITKEEEKAIRGFGFITMKPLQIVINYDESDISNREKIASEIYEKLDNKENLAVSYICGPVEEEIGKMTPEDAKEFMADYGLRFLGRDRMIRDTYNLLGLISFLTKGSDECRSWPIRGGTIAQRAAGAVHSDIERGFIAAEVIKYKDFKETPSLQELKQQGKVKIEGKEYLVEDGDIIDFRFNV